MKLSDKIRLNVGEMPNCPKSVDLALIYLAGRADATDDHAKIAESAEVLVEALKGIGLYGGMLGAQARRALAEYERRLKE